MPDARQKHNTHVNKNVFTKGPAKAVKSPDLKENNKVRGDGAGSNFNMSVPRDETQ